MFRTKLWTVMMLGYMTMLGLCGGCGSTAKKDNEAKAAKEAKTNKLTKKPKDETAKPQVSKENAAKKDNSDAVFVQLADQIDMAEVKIGAVAEKQAANGAVKSFGARMVKDHSRMNEDLRMVANKKGIELAEHLDAKHQALLDQLSALKGAEFDQLYTKDMVAGHEKAIAEFENEAKTGKAPEVKAWAEKWLPTLREHLAAAQAAVKDVQGK